MSEDAAGVWLTDAQRIDWLRLIRSAKVGPCKTAPQPPVVIDTAPLRAIFDDAIKIFSSEKRDNQAGEERRERREQADLLAQQEMARWTFWVVIAAGAQLFVGVFTLGFLWLAFWEARRTAKAGIAAAKAAARGNQLARELFVAEQRPWIPISVSLPSPLSRRDGAARTRITIKFENTGKTPAENVRYAWKMLPDAAGAKGELLRIAKDHKTREWTDADGPGEILFSGRDQTFKPKFAISLNDLTSEAVDGQYTLAVIVCVTYQTSVIKDRIQTLYFAEIQRNIKGQPRTFDLNDALEITAAQMRLAKTTMSDSGIAVSPADNDEDDQRED